MSYYDESLFVDGIAIKNYDPVGVSNRADEYLVKKYGKDTRPICVSTQAAVNPVVPCKGVNIYTMNRRHRVTHRVYGHSKIRVTADKTNTTTPITIGERTPNVVYDYNKELTPLEMAIMLKYYSMSLANRDRADDDTPLVAITPHLYHTVSEHFERADYCADRCARNWFEIESEDSVVVQTPDRELVFKNRIINLPDLTFYGPEATIH